MRRKGDRMKGRAQISEVDMMMNNQDADNK